MAIDSDMKILYTSEREDDDMLTGGSGPYFGGGFSHEYCPIGGGRRERCPKHASHTRGLWSAMEESLIHKVLGRKLHYDFEKAYWL